SSVLARRAAGPEFNGAYWAANLRQPVRFAETLQRLLDDGVTAAIELGPHPVLLPAMQQTAQSAQVEGADWTAVACGERDTGAAAALLSAVGTLWAAGLAIDWPQLMPAAPVADLPLHPWQ